MEFVRFRNVLKKYLKFLIQCILYLILSIVFVNFYLIDEIVNYTNGGTTLSSRTEHVEYLEAPYMTLCLQPPFKPAMLLKHGLPEDTKNGYDLFVAFQGMEMGIYEDLTYEFKKDFDIKLEVCTQKRRQIG